MNKCLWIQLLICLLVSSPPALRAETPVSDATTECMDCHMEIHPGIVNDWQNSRHAQMTPQKAAMVKGLANKLSSKTIPEELQQTAVGCAECHMLRPQAHADTFDHNGYDIHVVVSPDDCGTCHSQERAQYTQNPMSHAYGNLASNALFQQLEKAITGTPERANGRILHKPANAATQAETCYYCHGTRLEVTGLETRDTDLAGELEFPKIAGWPNHGVGRINLDGSKGACSPCHARHQFSMEMARKPYTCKECHIGPDVPAFKVYSASKHGNIFATFHDQWNFEQVPWTIGRDFTAPTCAACHISLLVNPNDEVVVKRTHQMTDRLAWRLFGLVYAHPQPKGPDTTVIRNKDGLPLPTDFAGRFASDYLIDESTQAARRQTMQATCLNCHDTATIRSHWQRLENTIQKTNAHTRVATSILEEAWKSGLADPSENPFDEVIEKKWTDIWQFYANTIRFASAMGGGGDYTVYAGGYYQLSQTLMEMNAWLTRHQGLHGEKQ
jgi:hydroxylamine dehydrogenase